MTREPPSVPAAAIEYIAHGWRIISLPPGQKKPSAPGWQQRENAVCTVESAAAVLGGVGLAHAYSGTCAIDVDDWQQANEWLAARGVNLAVLWSAPDAVQVLSGRPGRGKLLYALPTPLRSLRPAGSGLELRCASASGATVQDVLPPSVHPDTGKPYAWGGAGDWRKLPPLPPELRAIWDALLSGERERAESANDEPVGLSDEAILETLTRHDPNCGYHDWIRVGMALHHETRGDERGFDLWDQWSSHGATYPGSDKLRPHWDSFGHNSGPAVTMRSLGQVAPAEAFEVLPTSEQPERFRFTPAPEFTTRPEPQWLIKGVLPRAALAVLYGDPGAGKTFVALDMVAAIARGVPWKGHRVQQGAVAYVCAEGGAFFARRLMAYAHHHPDARLDSIYVCADSPNFLSDTDHKHLAHALRDIKPALIVIDTLARVMPGGNENASEDMGKALARCDWLHRKTGATVMLVHHSGKDAARGARGWSGLRGAADAEIVVLRDKENNERRIEIGKQKDGPDGGCYPFALGSVLLGLDSDGDPVTSCVIVDPPQDLSAGDGDKQPT